MCFLPSLRDLIPFDEWNPPLKRRAIVGCPCGTSVCLAAAIQRMCQRQCELPQTEKWKKISGRKRTAGIVSRRWPKADGAPLLEPVLADSFGAAYAGKKIKNEIQPNLQKGLAEYQAADYVVRWHCAYEKIYKFGLVGVYSLR
jgi:hypothetical protein